MPGTLSSPPLPVVTPQIFVALGYRFPMIRAHKVLAAYGCLGPPSDYRPIRYRSTACSLAIDWQYCRGGVRYQNSRFPETAVLPEGMSRERFEWLKTGYRKNDIIRTPGSESNVKEIYDTCNELEKDPDNVILNHSANLVITSCTVR
ncbi:MAG: hypothetical protein CM1200mP41_11500 [Gammaproteobacteria bacterium]|nr:MAG: hypothetical protein CM1200mP41_11500 [Gammaproteobacteria bacterium]